MHGEQQGGVLGVGTGGFRQDRGTALGVAIFGAVAGNPASADHFVSAMRDIGIASAILLLIVAAVTATGIKKGMS
jgi:MFS transporter, DHA2 family, methylenomycin A resistance protein